MHAHGFVVATNVTTAQVSVQLCMVCLTCVQLVYVHLLEGGNSHHEHASACMYTTRTEIIEGLASQADTHECLIRSCLQDPGSR